MKRKFTCAALLLTTALASSQSAPPQPKDFDPDPNQKKNAVPDMPLTRTLTAGPAIPAITEPFNAHLLNGPGVLQSSSLSGQSAIARLVPAAGNLNDLFRTIPNEKANAVPDMPAFKEMRNLRTTSPTELAPPLRSRGDHKLPSVPSDPKSK